MKEINIMKKILKILWYLFLVFIVASLFENIHSEFEFFCKLVIVAIPIFIVFGLPPIKFVFGKVKAFFAEVHRRWNQ